MLSLRRILGVFGGCLALTAVTVPVVALAHGGGHHKRGNHGVSNVARLSAHARNICRRAGMSMTSSGSFGHHGFRGSHGVELTATQTKELEAACTKLGAAFQTERSADEAAFTAEREALKAAKEKLLAACPTAQGRGHFRRFENRLRKDRARADRLRFAAVTGPTGPTGPTATATACEAAFTAYHTAVKAAKETFFQKVKAARETFGKALEEFDATVTTILSHSATPTGPTGPTGKKPTGMTGPTGPSGMTGPKGARCTNQGGPDHHGGSDGVSFGRGGSSNSGSSGWGGHQKRQDENCFEGEFEGEFRSHQGGRGSGPGGGGPGPGGGGPGPGGGGPGGGPGSGGPGGGSGHHFGGKR